MAEQSDQSPRNLEQLLEQLSGAVETERKQVSMGDILYAVGARSFAPLLLLVGVLIASPLSGIPFMPTAVAVIVLLVSLQMLMGRRHFWLPRWLLDRHVSRRRMKRTIDWLRPPARFIDRLIKPRLTIFVRGPATGAVALLCLGIGLSMPVLEFIPFSSSVAGFALAMFGLALVSSDGLLALLAYIVTGMTLWLLIAGLIL